MDPLQVALSLAGVVLVIFGCYYVMYFVGTRAAGQSRSRNAYRGRCINVLERFAISKDKSFCIVEIAGKIYVIGVSNQSMTIIDTLDADEFAQFNATRAESQPWHSMPGGYLGGRLTNKLASFIAQKIRKTPEAETRSNEDGSTFSDNMKAAREKDISRQPDRSQARRPDSPEDDE